MEKEKKKIRILKTIMIILLIVVSLFALVNLLQHNYIRDVWIKHIGVQKY